MKIPSVSWTNILNFKKVKYLHMIQINIWKSGMHVPFLFTNLYNICLYI